MIVYLAGAIQAFVMYCVNGTSRSSLLIESTDSMICICITFFALTLCYIYTSFFFFLLYMVFIHVIVHEVNIDTPSIYRKYYIYII